jgi:hypothetical protein
MINDDFIICQSEIKLNQSYFVVLIFLPFYMLCLKQPHIEVL